MYIVTNPIRQSSAKALPARGLGEFIPFLWAAWEPIYEQAKAMNAMQNNRLHLHGTLGAGKSLAGLVCQLQREGIRVVYLPDYYELLLC